MRNLIKNTTQTLLSVSPAGGAEIRFAEEGGEISPQFEPLLPIGRPLAGVGLGGAERVGGSAEFPPTSGGLTSLCRGYNQHYGLGIIILKLSRWK